MPVPTNKRLYTYVKGLASKKFKSPSGVYRSSWIVREYKKRGGRYSGKVDKNSGLRRWYREKWVDLNRVIRNKKKYANCGRKSVKRGGRYPLCRPTYRITRKTPKTYRELSRKSIDRARRLKSKYGYRKNVSFK